MAFNCSASELVIPYAEATDFVASRVSLNLALYIILVVSTPIWVGVFFFAKKELRYERLRVRKTSLVMTAALGCMIHAQVGPLVVVVGVLNFPCWIRSFLTMVIVPLFCTNILIKLLTFFFMSELSRGMTQVSRIDDDLFHADDTRWRTLASNVTYSMYAIFFNKSHKIPQNRLIVALSFVTSHAGIAWFTFIFCLPFVVGAAVMMATKPEFANQCKGCRLSIQEILEIIIVSLLILAFALVAGVRVWNFPDPWNLRTEVLWTCVFCVIALIGFVAGIYFDLGHGQTFDHQVEICLGFFAVLSLQTIFQVAMAHRKERSVFSKYLAHRKKRAEKNAAKRDRRLESAISGAETSIVKRSETGMSGTAVNLKTLMDSPELLKLFEEFLVNELQVENLLFLKDTDAWKHAYHGVSKSARVARARRIFKVYISYDGKFEVNISSRTGKKVKDVFAEKELEDVKQNIFDEARSEIFDLLQFGAVRRFQDSPAFQLLADPEL